MDFGWIWEVESMGLDHRFGYMGSEERVEIKDTDLLIWLEPGTSLCC